MKRENEIEINVAELTQYILKRWKVLAIIMAVSIICSFGCVKIFTDPVYESQSMIYITTSATDGGAVQNMLSSLQAGTALTADYKTLATSKPVLKKVIRELNLDMTYKELKDRVSTENPDNTRILTIKVKDPDPKRAKEIVDKLTEIERDKIADVMGQPVPNILQKGDIQTHPVSASPLKVSLFAGLIALMLTLIFFIGGYINSDSIVTAEDIEQGLGLSTLAEVPVFSSENKNQAAKKFRIPLSGNPFTFRKEKKK